MKISEDNKQFPKVKKKKCLFFKAGITLLITIIVIVSAMLFSNTSIGTSYKLALNRFVNGILNNSERTITDSGRVIETKGIDELQENLSFHVPRPLWMPEGYDETFAESVEHDKDRYSITYQFFNSNSNHAVEFNMLINSEMVISRDNHESLTELIQILDMDIILSKSYIDEVAYYGADYYNNQGFKITIVWLDDKETLIKIIENMSGN